jgi:hypothetical protein
MLALKLQRPLQTRKLPFFSILINDIKAEASSGRVAHNLTAQPATL